MTTFRVSEAESYRRWREDEDADLEMLLARLRGQVPPSPKMEAGTAFHKVLENAGPGELAIAEANGFRFIIEANIEIALAPIREVRGHKQYPGITITGQLDEVDGLRVDDHKTTERFEPEGYIEGYQWRFYLDIFEARTFRWNVFEMREVEPKVYLVHGFHVLEQCRYPQMHRDCERLAIDLADFAREFMPERQEAQAA